ncbi:MAG: hypothetical protein JXR83_12090 [Deltaproteobacteria bacterium]|nr:hypothetical protein [Deltaproteobacteria bacterium]
MTSIRDQGLRNIFPSIIADNKIDRADVDKMIEVAKDGPGLSKTERKDLNNILREHGDKFDADAKAALEAFLGGAAPTPPTPTPPASGTLSTKVSGITDLATIATTFADEMRDRASEFSDPKKAFALFAEYGGKLKALASGQDPKKVDAEVDKLLAAGRQTPARGYDAKDTDYDTMSDLAEAARGRDPEKFDSRVMEGDHKVWTDTYWPMAGYGGGLDQAGSPGSNLWAKEGPLAKLDKLLNARGMSDKAKALEFERKPALSWLIGDRANKGEFIPSSTIRESDAEWTTGVDFDGDGKISKDVKVDFLDSRGDFAAVGSRSALKPKIKEGDKVIDLTRKEIRGSDGKISGFEFSKPDGTKLTPDQAKEVYYTHAAGDGKVDGSMSVGWWGSCDKVALAGILFKEPMKDSISIDGVTFTKQDMQGLLVVIADSQARGTDFVGNRYDDKPDILVTKDGKQRSGKIENDIEFRVKGMWRWDGDFMVLTDHFKASDQPIKFRNMDGTVEEIKATDVKHLAREDHKDLPPLEFHSTILKWLGEDKRPAAMDKDSGSHVWNYNFWKAELKDGKELTGSSRPTTPGDKGPIDPNNKVVEYSMDICFGDSDYGTNYRYWLEYNAAGEAVNGGWISSNPDFLWRPSAFNDWSGSNTRNPYVDPKMVKEIYDKFFDT